MPTTDEARQRLAQQQDGSAEVVKRDLTEEAVLEKIHDAVERVLPVGIEPRRFNRILLTTLRRNPELLKAERASLFGAIVTAAECGLEPGTHEGHCWIVGPFRNRGRLEAVFMLGYKGLVELALRSGRVASIIARPVYHGEPFTYRETLERTVLQHDPMLDGMPDRLRGCYAIARLTDDGVPISAYLSRDQIESYRRRSKSPDGPGWTDDYVAMAMKTAVKRLEPWLPKSPALRTAVLADEQVARWEGGDVQVERDEGEAIVVNTVRDEGPGDTAPQDDADDAPAEEGIDALRKPQLVKRLRDAGLDHQGKVEELRERWRAHLEGSSGGGAADPSFHGEGSDDPPAPPEEHDTPAADDPVPSSAAGDQEPWRDQAERLGVKVVPLLNALKGSWGSLSRRLGEDDRDRRPPANSQQVDALADDYPDIVAEVIDRVAGEVAE